MESLGIDIKLLIAQIINFGLFFFIFKKYIAKPFSNFLADEVKKEQEKEKVLNELKKKDEEMIASQNKLKVSLKKELEMAIKKSKDDAGLYKATLIAEAKSEAEEIIAKGKKQIEVEKKASEKELKNKVIELSTIIVEKAFNKYLSKDTQKDINKNILKNFESNLN
ncbi:MAG: ATP synthase F0 subunit B [Candidatus Roizmanbacteria bacterium]|nr:ATP synthase F0 subunit B [Candidatus Roizmanbacteria bacterium]